MINNRRIIMADPELHYILKLQVKFLQELQDSYEIDVITDREFFDSFFLSPQNADCLIISEGWASSDLTKHNIDHVVVLTDATIGDTVSTPYKAEIPRYTSTEEIYNQIRNILGAGITNSATPKKDASVIMFHSASGGTGKTVLALALSEYLSSKYYRVLYVNTQSIQSFQFFLNNKSAVPNEVAMQLKNEDANAFGILRKSIREERFTYLPPFGMPLFSYGIKNSIYNSLIEEAKASKEFDYVIVDSGCCFDNDTAEMIALSDKIVMVTNPDFFSLYSLRQLLNNMSVKEGKLVKLCNRVRQEPIKELAERSRLAINECISDWEQPIDADALHSFSKSEDIQKLAVLVG